MRHPRFFTTPLLISLVAIGCDAESEPVDSEQQLDMSLLEQDEDEEWYASSDEDPVATTGRRIGDKIEPDGKPPGVQADGTVNLALVPEWIPVGSHGEIVGYAKKADVHYMPSTPEEALRGTTIPIYDEDTKVIGRFVDGLPTFDLDLTTAKEDSTAFDHELPLTLRKVTAAWPLPQSILWYLQNYVPLSGYAGECARHASGSSGALFLSSSTGWVSLGGNCNTTSLRPPGWLGSRSRAYSGGVLVADTGFSTNLAWSYIHQTTLAHLPGQNWWCGDSYYHKSVVNYFVTTGFCSG